MTSKYKSEFLANMSHELRTPLNSILILGQQLGDNADGNLTEKQVEFAKTIHAAGSDLLNLISDILDLSKIESGTVSVDAEEIFLPSLVEILTRPFRHEAENRGLYFETILDADITRNIFTDAKRLQQVLKNLLSNAFKFTAEGGVTLKVDSVTDGWNSDNMALNDAPAVLAFEVSDTGIGIPPEKQRIIFEAFQQADAGTSRKYGGTGLGLAISRELAALLGGEIQLRSAPGQGSTFTLFLPQIYAPPISMPIDIETSRRKLLSETKARTPHEPIISQIADDRESLSPGDNVLLIVDDDPNFTRTLVHLAKDCGFRTIVAHNGSDAIALATEYTPSAISLDVYLPDMLGWSVLSQLKQNAATRHIPVQLVTLDEDRRHGLAHGAFSFVTKPATPEVLNDALHRLKQFGDTRQKRLLVVEDNPAGQLSIRELLGHDDIEIEVADTGLAALKRLRSEKFDCVVLDLTLPDISGFEVMQEISSLPVLNEIPVVVFTGRELTTAEETALHEMARSVVVKGVKSPERLLDETALFLHRSVRGLPVEKQRMLERLHKSDEALNGRIVLIVDDDARNLFALSSVLERHGMSVLAATTGREALERLEQTPNVSIVLMDIMMPEMDGYQTMQAIRTKQKWRSLPIIALTAKAMKGDREKCLEAGASDYLAKPVNTDQLLTSLRIWLHR